MHYVIMLANAFSKSHQFPDGAQIGEIQSKTITIVV